jgi:hypothetical protein
MGVRITVVPPERKTSSKEPLNLASRSWMRNRTAGERSSRSMVRFLACWVIQDESGWAVVVLRWTRRLWSSMKTRT